MADDEQLRRAVDAAMVPMVASLGGAGVVAAHWRPDRDGEPVVWLRTTTEIARVQLETQSWVRPQVTMILSRLGVPYATVARLRLEITSQEADDALFEE